MYILRTAPPESIILCQGITLDEAFVRMMALTERYYEFVRTGWAMQLLMTDHPHDAEFLAHATNDAVARQEIKSQVCRHGLGLFQLLTDAEYACAIAERNMAAE